jgi:hypothetical protein
MLGDARLALKDEKQTQDAIFQRASDAIHALYVDEINQLKLKAELVLEEQKQADRDKEPGHEWRELYLSLLTETKLGNESHELEKQRHVYNSNRQRTLHAPSRTRFQNTSRSWLINLRLSTTKVSGLESSRVQ